MSSTTHRQTTELSVLSAARRIASSAGQDGDSDFVLVRASDLGGLRSSSQKAADLRTDPTPSIDEGAPTKDDVIKHIQVRDTSLELKASKEDTKEVKETSNFKLSILKQLQGRRAGIPSNFETVLHHGGTLQTPANGKYQWSWALTGSSASTSLVPNDVTNGGEWSSFNSVFEEAFIKRMVVKFEPYNQFLANYVNSTSTNLQTCGLTIAAYQHDQPAATDGNSNYYQFLNSTQSKVCSSGRPWVFTWKNIDKFSWSQLAGTASGFQGWMNMSDMSNYGGRVQIASQQLASTTPTSGALTVSTNAGTFYISFDVAMRYRD